MDARPAFFILMLRLPPNALLTLAGFISSFLSVFRAKQNPRGDLSTMDPVVLDYFARLQALQPQPDTAVTLARDTASLLGRFIRFTQRWRKQLAMFSMLAVLVSAATAANAPGEVKRRYDNGQRVRKLQPYMQGKVTAILTDLEGHGEKPLIDPAVVRTAAQQAALVKKGNSTINYSFHNAGLAADIYDNYTGQAKTPNSFWLKLASSAQSHDLQTGVVWGLSTANRNKIQSLIKNRSWATKYTRGWDPAHVEPRPTAITLDEAKRGLRPPVKRKR